MDASSQALPREYTARRRTGTKYLLRNRAAGGFDFTPGQTSIRPCLSLILLAIAAAAAALGLVLLWIARASLRRRRWQGALAGGLGGLLLLTVGALLLTISVAIRGYRALTREEVAATVRTVPIGGRHFQATIRYPDGREEVFLLAGDSIYMDAHILKWHPWVNLLGLHTAYELDRVAGRYDRLADEREGPRTVYSLARPKPLDLFDVVRRLRRLAILVDAEYGSATFVGTRGAASWEILVSTTGLLARPAAGTGESGGRK